MGFYQYSIPPPLNLALSSRQRKRTLFFNSCCHTLTFKEEERIHLHDKFCFLSSSFFHSMNLLTTFLSLSPLSLHASAASLSSTVNPVVTASSIIDGFPKHLHHVLVYESCHGNQIQISVSAQGFEF